jgi:dephospho-CoA kinase
MKISEILYENHITEDDLEEGVNDPHIFKIIFMAGGPGSGKSFVSNKLLQQTGLKTINSDDIYEYMMKQKNLDMNPETIFSPQGQEIRGKAKEITKRKQNSHIDGRLGLIIDGTGKDVNKIAKLNEKFKALGYDTSMLFVNTSEEVAQERNQKRERSLPKEEVSAMWSHVQDNLMKFQQIFGASKFHILDNSGGLEDPTRAKSFHQVGKELDKFLNASVSSPAAKEWIASQRQK